MPGCAPFDPLGPYVTGMTGFVDCHARALGEEGYRALGVGSPVGLAITGLLTIYVALVGYRMLLGDVPSLREGVVNAVRIGLVLALASQWPAYQTLVYKVVIDGPGEIAERILAPGGLGDGDASGLSVRVQGAYNAIEIAARPDADAAPDADTPPTSGPDGPAVPADEDTEPAATVDSTLGLAGQILLVTTLAAMLSVRVIAGLMLALGPIFIACLLFGAMRGLFEGWVRTLAGAALGAISVTAVLTVELAIVEPQVSAFLRARAAQQAVPLLAGQLLASTGLFALVLLGALIATTRAAAGFRLPDGLQAQALRLIAPATRQAQPVIAASSPALAANDDRPRAVAVADALGSQQRREQQAARSDLGSSPDRRVASLATASSGSLPAVPVPLGQSYRRTATQRRSASASRRDATG